MKKLSFFLRATYQSYLIICSILMKMEWPEDHDIQLAKDVLVSEPYRFKPRAVYARLPAVRTVKRAKIWQYEDYKSRPKALGSLSGNSFSKPSINLRKVFDRHLY